MSVEFDFLWQATIIKAANVTIINLLSEFIVFSIYWYDGFQFDLSIILGMNWNLLVLKIVKILYFYYFITISHSQTMKASSFRMDL